MRARRYDTRVRARVGAYTKKTLFNPNPGPQQLDKDERVERIRRIHLNDIENLPFFLVSSLLFVLTDVRLSCLAARSHRRLSDRADPRHARHHILRRLAYSDLHDGPGAARGAGVLKVRKETPCPRVRGGRRKNECPVQIGAMVHGKDRGGRSGDEFHR